MTLFESILLQENKDRFIRALPWEEGETETILDFFHKHANLESKINWQNKDKEEIKTEILSLMDLTKKNAATKAESKQAYKDLPKFGADWKVYYESDNWIYAMPFSWQACKYADSRQCGGQGARWCVGYEKDSTFFNNYFVKNKSAFLLAFNKNCEITEREYDTLDKDEQLWRGLKYMIRIYVEDYSDGTEECPQEVIDDNEYDLCVEIWDQPDDCIAMFNYYDAEQMTEDGYVFDQDSREFGDHCCPLTELGTSDYISIFNTFVEWRKTFDPDAQLSKIIEDACSKMRIKNVASGEELINAAISRFVGECAWPLKYDNVRVLDQDENYYYILFNSPNTKQLHEYYSSILNDDSVYRDYIPDSICEVLRRVVLRMEQIVSYKDINYKERFVFNSYGFTQIPFFIFNRQKLSSPVECELQIASDNSLELESLDIKGIFNPVITKLRPGRGDGFNVNGNTYYVGYNNSSDRQIYIDFINKLRNDADFASKIFSTIEDFCAS